jgi:membrane-bound serine protease (ClpP class)
MSGLILAPTPAGGVGALSATAPPECTEHAIVVGDIGGVTSPLRPAGKARFGDAVVDVVATAEFLEQGAQVEIIEIHGNRVVVKRAENA